MVDLRYADLPDGNGLPATFLTGVAQTARNVACELYRNDPVRALGDSLGLPNLSPLKPVFDEMCTPRAAPVDPPGAPPPFRGGQCQGVNYTVSGRYRDSLGNIQSFSSPGLAGAIGGLTFVNDGPPPNTQAYAVIRGVGPPFRVTGYDVPGGLTEGRITSVVPTGGGPDNCGDPPLVYPPSTNDVNLWVKPNVSISVPVNVSPVFAPVLVRPTLNVGPVNIRPTVSVDVGGITVNFDFGGITFESNVNIGVNLLAPSPPPAYPPSVPPVLSPSPNAPAAKKDVAGVLQEVEDCCPEDPTPPSELLSVPYIPAVSRVVPLPPKTKFVALSLIGKPDQPRQEFGVVADDVYYAGWASFDQSGAHGLRFPIDFENKMYFPPEYASQFSYTCRIGYTASVVVFYEPPD